MEKEDILKIAKYICFPYRNKVFGSKYDNSGRDIHKLPIFKDKDVLYSNMPGNEHHYTTEYTYKYVLPLVDELIGFGFNQNDFHLVPLILKTGDLSYLFPNNEPEYTITCFNDNETINGGYMKLFNENFMEIPSYRLLNRYNHKCSRIVNHTTKSERKLMVSGDSQMIPSIAPLTYYFKEVWYFDNRTGYIKNKETNKFEFHEDKFVSFSETYKDTTFTDVIMQLYCRDLNWYEYWNLY